MSLTRNSSTFDLTFVIIIALTVTVISLTNALDLSVQKTKHLNHPLVFVNKRSPYKVSPTRPYKFRDTDNEKIEILEAKLVLIIVAKIVHLVGIKIVKLLVPILWLKLIWLCYHFLLKSIFWLKPLAAAIYIAILTQNQTPVQPEPGTPAVPVPIVPVVSLPITLIRHDRGNNLIVVLNGNDCFDIDPVFVMVNKLGSIDTNGQCVSLFRDRGCMGPTADLRPIMGQQFPPTSVFPAPAGDYEIYSLRRC